MVTRILNASELYPYLDLTAGTVTDHQKSLISAAISYAEGVVRSTLRYDPVIGVRTEYYPSMDLTTDFGPDAWEVNDNVAYIRRLSQEGSDKLQVAGLPVRETDEQGANPIDLRIDYDGRAGTQTGAFAVETQQTEGTDFWPNYDLIDSGGRKMCNDGIIRSYGRWPNTSGSVKIVYVSGYTASELAGTDSRVNAAPIREAVLEEALTYVHRAWIKRGGVGGWGIGPYTSENLGDYSYSADTTWTRQVLGSGQISARSAALLEPFINFGSHLYL